jgi:uncharacterized membrane protein
MSPRRAPGKAASGTRPRVRRSAGRSFRPVGRLVLPALAIAYLAYPFVIHRLLAAGRPRIALGLAAVALGGLCWSLTDSRWRWLALSMIAVTSLAAGALHADELVLFLPPIAINLGLALFFASTLARGREPLISWFARVERGELAPDLEAYTRRLTWIWVGFFLLMAAASLVLAVIGPRMVWAWFTAVGNYLCVGMLFVGEYVYRRVRFSHYRHASPLRLLGIVRRAIRELR